MISNYQKLEQAVREGVRTSSRLLDMTANVCFDDHDLRIIGGNTQINSAFCSDNTRHENTSALDCRHSWIQSRVREVVRHQKLLNFSSQPEEISSREALANITSLFCSPVNPAGGTITCNDPDGNDRGVNCSGTQTDTISIFISGEYEGFFGNWPLSTSYQGPWLYQNSQGTVVN